MEIDFSNPYTIAWIVWALGFLGIEGAALFNAEKNDTLSEHIWKIFDVNKQTDDPKEKKIRKGRMTGLGAIMVLGTMHFLGLV